MTQRVHNFNKKNNKIPKKTQKTQEQMNHRKKETNEHKERQFNLTFNQISTN